MTCAWMETFERADRFVADDEVGVERDRARDADALALAAGELVRVAVHVARLEADAFEEPAHAVALLPAARDAVDRQRLADDGAGGHPRVQRRIRVLENDLHVPPLEPQFFRREAQDVAPAEHDPAAGRLDQAEDRAPGGGLAAAALADQAERLLAPERERDAVHRLHLRDHLAQQALADGEMLLQVGDRQQRFVPRFRRSVACVPYFTLHSALRIPHFI